MFCFSARTPSSIYSQTRIQQLPVIPVKATNYNILERPSFFHKRLLELIKTAKERIMMTVLYLQDDDTGREILNALYEAQKERPTLHISIYVDFHRAQRGLIGKDSQLGNSELYYKLAKNCEHPPAIYGVPVKKREIFGVMHLKGCVFDNTVLYSGASINDVYLNGKDKYRLDRYHEIVSKDLADTMCAYVNSAFHINYSVQDFSQGFVKSAKEIKDDIKALTRHLTVTQYDFKGSKIKKDEIGICPLVGLGKKNNQLNKVITWIIKSSKKKLFICTPYFNPPSILKKCITEAIECGVEITIVVGDKKANDFYISKEEDFNAIGAIPYIYEQNLREFVAKHQKYIDDNKLHIMLWEDGANTYHLKGIFSDNNLAIITGNNLNPRAWARDLENGLLIRDPNHLMQEKFVHEQQYILKNTKKILSIQDIESEEQYPEPVRKILNKVKRLKATVLIRQLL